MLLSNNTGITGALTQLHDRFLPMYRVKAHLHHYLDFMEPSGFEEALNCITDVVSAYNGASLY
jgi:tubulin epsilon